MKNSWTLKDVMTYFHIANKNTLVNAEEKGFIPSSHREQSGSLARKYWYLNEIPLIGMRYGFIKKPSLQKVITCYAPKGGVLKTTQAYNLARALALNGIKTIVIGLDFQCSLTSILLPEIYAAEDIEEIPAVAGLYHYLFEKVPLERVIVKTNLPTLDVIPETSELIICDKKMSAENRREYIFNDRLIPALSEYEVIIFDNNPGWSRLVENSLVCSKHVVSPFGCDIETFRSVEKNIAAIFEFKEAMKLNWDSFTLIPTLLETTKISQQIYSSYILNYKEYVTTEPIKRNIIGQEASLKRISVLEHSKNSELGEQYFRTIKEIWGKISFENGDLA